MRWTHIDEHLVGDSVIVDLRDPHLMQLDPEGDWLSGSVDS